MFQIGTSSGMNNRVHAELNWKVINEEKRDWGKGLVFDRLMYSNEKRSLRDERSRRVWIYAHKGAVVA